MLQAFEAAAGSTHQATQPADKSASTTPAPEFTVAKTATDLLMIAYFQKLPEAQQSVIRQKVEAIEQALKHRSTDSVHSTNMNNNLLTSLFNELNQLIQRVTGKPFTSAEMVRITDEFRNNLTRNLKK